MFEHNHTPRMKPRRIDSLAHSFHLIPISASVCEKSVDHRNIPEIHQLRATLSLIVSHKMSRVEVKRMILVLDSRV
ncbi:MAG: hypothetical protein MUC43_04975 [Pirellula sp.]|nr:hypothetical protein [Pirellula sp.]